MHIQCATVSYSDYCNPNPCHNGRCQQAGNKFRCVCNPGYIGNLCQTDKEGKIRKSILAS